MKYFSFAEILLSGGYSIAFGMLFGLIGTAFEVISMYFESLLCIPLNVLKLSGSFSRDNIKKYTVIKLGKTNEFLQFIQDLLYVLFFGISLLVLLYAICDGIFRLYVLLLAVVFAVLSNKFIGKHFKRLFLMIFSYAYFLLIFVLSIFLTPIKFFFSRLIQSKLICFPVNFIRGLTVKIGIKLNKMSSKPKK